MIEDSRTKARALLAKGVDFHGHLGPFLILGLRMGVIAESLLKPQNQNALTATILVKGSPPTSCVIDGVQVSSGCTLGKGTIRVEEASDRVLGKFRAGCRACTIAVKNQVVNKLLRALIKEPDRVIIEMAEDMMNRTDDELFEVA
jgi:formylmethanofuran dehydrogenase subunit E